MATSTWRTRGRAAALGLCLCLGPATACSSTTCSSSESKCVDECATDSTIPVAWGDTTALGSPEATFSGFAGTCQAAFRWDGSAFGEEILIDPVQGESTLTATVLLDGSTARFVTQTPATCPSHLAVEGTVTLELAEGKVADRRPVTLTQTAGTPLSPLTFSLPEEAFGPWVSIRATDPALSLTMSVSVTALAQACSGQIFLYSRRGGDGWSSGGAGGFATWSSGQP